MNTAKSSVTNMPAKIVLRTPDGVITTTKTPVTTRTNTANHETPPVDLSPRKTPPISNAMAATAMKISGTAGWIFPST